MKWFRTFENEQFSPTFQAFMRRLLVEPSRWNEDKFDTLSALTLFHADHLVRTMDDDAAMYLTLIGACLHDCTSAEDRAFVVEVLSKDKIYKDLQDQVQVLTTTGIEGLLHALHLPRKSETVQLLYKNLGVRFFHNHAHTLCLMRDGLMSPATLTLAACRNEMANEPADLVGDAIHMQHCSLEFFFDSGPTKFDRTIDFINAYASYSGGSVDEADPVDLINGWLTELVQLALIKGFDTQRVIESAKPIIKAIVQAFDIRSDGQIFERQLLLNALLPFPDALLHLKPTPEDFLPTAQQWYPRQIDSRLSCPPLHSRRGRDFGVDLFFDTLQALGIEPSASQILNTPTKFRLVPGFLRLHAGHHPEIEQWFVDKCLAEAGAQNASQLFKFFDRDKLSESTRLALHLFKVDNYINTKERLYQWSVMFPGLERTEEHERAMIQALNQRGELTREAMEQFSFDTRLVRPYLNQIDRGARRAVFENDLGL